MAYKPRHMKPQVRALLIEAMGPGSPQLTYKEFEHVEDARYEMESRWNDANERCDYVIEDPFIDGDFAENGRYAWQVYEIKA